MIQDIAPSKLNNQYIVGTFASGDDLALVFWDNQLLVKKSVDLEFPTVSLFEGAKLTYAFSIDEERFFFVDTSEILLDEFEFIEVRSIREKRMEPKKYVFAALTAKHLMDWYRDNKFCGRCGKKMEHSKTERAMTCACGYTSYPRIMPAVIVGVLNKDRILVTRYRRGYQHNALVAGFTEIGETVEETVAREVMEEAGIRVKNIRYYKSQPWGIANDILLGYFCEVDGDSTIHMDEQELKFAEWLTAEELELQPDDFSLTNEMMCTFKEKLL